jgi:hypothetical protein
MFGPVKNEVKHFTTSDKKKWQSLTFADIRMKVITKRPK